MVVNTEEIIAKPGGSTSLILEGHNKLRRKAGLFDVHTCPLLESKAEEHAAMLATSNNKEDLDKQYWSSISTSTKKEKSEAVKDAIGQIKGAKKSDFLHPLVGSLGVGAAKSDDGWVVVMLCNAPKLNRGVQYRGSI